jgi:quercetin dioxygenase-like cupin family protein
VLVVKQIFRKYVVLLMVAFGVFAGVPALSVLAQDSTPTAATPVVREVLASTEAAEAPGEEFALSRYTIAPGAILPIHTHPGVQVTTIESGTLTYHVVENGEAVVTRADGTKETFGPGSSTELTVGDSIVEPEGMVHYGENLTDEPIVLISASLFTEGAPASTIVQVATPAP